MNDNAPTVFEGDVQIVKYPRTRHVDGSRIQTGDEDLNVVPFEQIRGRHVVVEEKIDGGNAGISFDTSANLKLQSRGHFLVGGPREKHFALLKQWANLLIDPLFTLLEDRYIMYGEWMYPWHTVFYDALPHYFMEFDIYDKQERVFLDTPRRRDLLGQLPIKQVLVLFDGQLETIEQLTDLIGDSHFKTENWKATFERICQERNIDLSLQGMVDNGRLMEGLYIKVEEGGQVVERYKYVRAEFIQKIKDSDVHWQSRPIIPNQLSPGVDIFAL